LVEAEATTHPEMTIVTKESIPEYPNTASRCSTRGTSALVAGKPYAPHETTWATPVMNCTAGTTMCDQFRVPEYRRLASRRRTIQRARSAIPHMTNPNTEHRTRQRTTAAASSSEK
jgi:hypothetical protein